MYINENINLLYYIGSIVNDECVSRSVLIRRYIEYDRGESVEGVNARLTENENHILNNKIYEISCSETNTRLSDDIPVYNTLA